MGGRGTSRVELWGLRPDALSFSWRRTRKGEAQEGGENEQLQFLQEISSQKELSPGEYVCAHWGGRPGQAAYGHKMQGCEDQDSELEKLMRKRHRERLMEKYLLSSWHVRDRMWGSWNDQDENRDRRQNRDM